MDEHVMVVKAIQDGEQWIIEGWGAPDGGPEDGRDAQGEYFDAKTDFGLEMFPSRPAIFHHGLTEDNPQVIGREQFVERRDRGLWVRVVLDKTKELAKKAWGLAQEGKLFFSSGSINHLVRKGDGGRIIKWPVVEWSLTPQPANKYAVAFAAAKANMAEIGIELDEAEPESGEQPIAATVKRGPDPEPIKIKQRGETMEESLYEHVKEVLTEIEDQRKAESEKLELAELRDKVKALKTERDEFEAKANRKIPFPTGVEVKGTVWDQMDPMDRELIGMLMAKQGKPLSEELRRSIKGGLEENMPKYKAFLDDAEIKAIALMDRTDTANWRPANYEGMIWDRLRLENRVASVFRQIDMPTDNYYLPTATAGPTVYVVPEQTAGTPTLATGITTSQVTDAKVTLATSKLGAASWFSGELDEDSVIPMLPFVRDQIGKAMDEAVEYVLLSGDKTTGTTSITVATSGTTDACVAVDGLRHFGLVDATTYKVDVGALTADDFLSIRSKMGKYGVNPEDLVWFTDYNTIYKALGLDEVLTLDKMGSNATILRGQMASVFGSPLIVSGQMNKFGVDGKYSATPTTGILICAHKPSWIIGWRRRIKFGVNYYDHLDSTRVTALLRMDFQKFGTTEGHACVGYNITV